MGTPRRHDYTGRNAHAKALYSRPAMPHRHLRGLVVATPTRRPCIRDNVLRSSTWWSLRSRRNAHAKALYSRRCPRRCTLGWLGCRNAHAKALYSRRRPAGPRLRYTDPRRNAHAKALYSRTGASRWCDDPWQCGAQSQTHATQCDPHRHGYRRNQWAPDPRSQSTRPPRQPVPTPAQSPPR